MWLYNLRGSDIKHCPVALSFAFVDMDYAYIFLKEEALSEAVKAYLASFGVIICDYEDVYVFLADYPYSGEVLVDDRNVSVNAYRAITKAGAKVFLAPSPVELREPEISVLIMQPVGLLPSWMQMMCGCRIS